VPDFTLTAEPFLGGYSRDFDGTTLVEVTDVSITSIAQPLGGREALATAVRSAWGCALPAPGETAKAGNGHRLFCTGPDSFLLTGTGVGDPAAKALKGAAYVTDQSDAWVTLRLTGPLARPALERICPIDLHPDALPVKAFARTVMEHLGAILLVEGADDFTLMSASSSAKSFLHGIEVSLANAA
jgi:methylglutamate dehydrogenase subunit D